MAVLAADINVAAVGVPRIAGGFSANAADTYFKGSIVWIDTGGGVQVTAAAGDRVLGVSTKNQVIAAVGDPVEVAVDGLFWFYSVPSGIAAADEGAFLLFDADGTLSDNIADTDSTEAITEAANDCIVGRLLKVETGRMLVHIGNRTGALYDATAAAFI